MCSQLIVRVTNFMNLQHVSVCCALIVLGVLWGSGKLPRKLLELA